MFEGGYLCVEVGHHCRELSTRAHLELVVRVRQVGLDGAHREEQGLRDLAVRAARRRQACHAILRRGEGVGCIYSVHPREQGIWTWRRTRVRPVEGAGDSPTHQTAPLRS